MKTATNYAGIDYGLGRSNVDAETGMRYGVISQGSLMPEALDDVYTQSRDLSFERAQAEAKTELDRLETVQELAEWLDEHLMLRRGETAIGLARYILDGYTVENDPDTIRITDRAEITAHIWAEIEDNWNDLYSMNDCGDWLYERDGYRLTNCLQSDVFVLASPYFTYAQFCSPCVPGACNLDSPLEQPSEANKCLCLGHDWFEGGKAPYPVYSVATGEIVQPEA